MTVPQQDCPNFPYLHKELVRTKKHGILPSSLALTAQTLGWNKLWKLQWLSPPYILWRHPERLSCAPPSTGGIQPYKPFSNGSQSLWKKKMTVRNASCWDQTVRSQTAQSLLGAILPALPLCFTWVIKLQMQWVSHTRKKNISLPVASLISGSTGGVWGGFWFVVF